MSIEPFYSHLGAAIRAFRLARGMTQQEVGARLRPQLSRLQVHRHERAKHQMYVHQLVGYANALGVDTGELLSYRPNGSRTLR